MAFRRDSAPLDGVGFPNLFGCSPRGGQKPPQQVEGYPFFKVMETSATLLKVYQTELVKEFKTPDDQFRIADARFHLYQVHDFQRRAAAVGPVLG